MRKLIGLVLVTVFTAFMSIYARSQQDSGKLLFENDQLRAVEYMIQAGGKVNLKSNAPYLFFSLTVSPGLPPQGRTILLNLLNQHYVPPKRTLKIPPGFRGNDKKEGARLAVRVGDTLKFCNVDDIRYRPFSYSTENKFESIRTLGPAGIRQGQCWTYVVKNPTRDPIVFKLFDDIHASQKLFVVVLPAGYPDEGEEDTPSGESSSTTLPNTCGVGRTWSEEESGYTSVWTRQGDSDIFEALYTTPGGGKATTRNSVTLDGNTITAHRLGSSDTHLCTYSGTITGSKITGTYKCPSAWTGDKPWSATINCN